jgi:hypothetical protein
MISLRRLRVKEVLFCFGLIQYSCCPFVKEDYLGSNFILSEYDNVDRRILYSNERCSGSGTEIVPMTVSEYAFDDKWIVAKADSGYWIVNKDTNLRYLSDSITSKPSIPEAKLNGPYDSAAFVQKLNENSIKLKLKKI